MQSFHVDSWRGIRIGLDVSEWFPVNVGLRQGCVMNFFIKGSAIDNTEQVLGTWVKE